MSDSFTKSDKPLLDLLRRGEAMMVSEFASAMGVTATAVRQRLNRLLAQGLLARDTSRDQRGRGRPVHRYRLTKLGTRKAGTNFADLAIVLWSEIRDIKDTEVRRGLLKRIAARLAEMYEGVVEGVSVDEKMESLADLFSQGHQVPFEVSSSNGLPVLTALACPYPDLAEQDRSVCSMERILISEVVGQEVKLGSCRLDGDACCSFEPIKSGPASGAETPL
jgi:DeoR family transcriptional regulator, suf operon transcriptional repressor